MRNSSMALVLFSALVIIANARSIMMQNWLDVSIVMMIGVMGIMVILDWRRYENDKAGHKTKED